MPNSERIKNQCDAEARIRSFLSSSRDLLPPLPQILLKVQSAIRDENSGARDIARIILKDPSLTAKVLKLANSAFYRQSKRHETTITGAIVLLGFDAIRNVVLGLSVYNIMSRLPASESFRAVWKHSLGTAVCAHRLGQRAHFPVPEEVFVAGLIHDLGKLILGQIFPKQYKEVMKLIEEGGMATAAAERKVLKIDHSVAGEMIAEYWNFPESAVEAMRYHESDRDLTKFKKHKSGIVNAVAAANVIAHFVYEDEPQYKGIEYEEVQGFVQRITGIGSGDVAMLSEKLHSDVVTISKVFDVVSVVDEEEIAAAEAAEEAIEEKPKVDHKADTVVDVPVSDLQQASQPDDEPLSRSELLLVMGETSEWSADFLDFTNYTASKFFDTMGLDNLLLFFPDKKAKSLYASYACGSIAEKFKDDIEIKLDQGDEVSAWAFVSGEKAMLDPSNFHRFSRKSEYNAITMLRTFNILAQPIRKSAKTLGVLLVSRPATESPMSEEDQRIVSAYARHIADVMQRSGKA